MKTKAMKTIKTFALLLVALFVVQGAVAQTREKTVVKTDSTTVITIVKTFGEFTPKHDIRVGVGTLSAATSLLLDDWGLEEALPRDFRSDMASTDTYLTPRYFVGNYSLSYTYQDRRWLQYGGKIVFGASTRWLKSAHTGEKIDNLSYYGLSVMPSVRFNWFYRDAVQLYSTISVGVITDFDEVYPWGDLTLVGCSFGRKFFGFAEVGMGMAGWLRAGVGYRFNAVKK
jgi:hypothetical protein